MRPLTETIQSLPQIFHLPLNAAGRLRPLSHHGRIQRQQISLKGNAVNHAYDVGNAAGVGRNRLHGGDDLIHGLPPPAQGRRAGLQALASYESTLKDEWISTKRY